MRRSNIRAVGRRIECVVPVVRKTSQPFIQLPTDVFSYLWEFRQVDRRRECVRIWPEIGVGIPSVVWMLFSVQFRALQVERLLERHVDEMRSKEIAPTPQLRAIGSRS